MIDTKTIFLTGGGTGGSATPLIAIMEKLTTSNRTDKLRFVWIGSNDGPEKYLIDNINRNAESKIIYHSIAYGKLRRYLSVENLIDPFRIIVGFFQSLWLTNKYKPSLILSAGSYISVPVVWAGGIFQVPAMIHQQDFRPGLANKLMAPFCRTITATFEKSLDDYGEKAIWTGNLVRQEFIDYKIDRQTALQKIGLNSGQPVIFVIGGGTGALFINDLIIRNLKELTKFCQIIHVTGNNRISEIPIDQPNYRRFDFMHIDGLIKAYKAADLVVSRAGMGILSELAYLAKPAVIIPMPDSHQENNAACLENNAAAVVLDQQKINDSDFVAMIKKLASDKLALEAMGARLSRTIRIDLEGKVIGVINKLISIKE